MSYYPAVMTDMLPIINIRRKSRERRKPGPLGQPRADLFAPSRGVVQDYAQV